MCGLDKKARSCWAKTVQLAPPFVRTVCGDLGGNIAIRSCPVIEG